MKFFARLFQKWKEKAVKKEMSPDEEAEVQLMLLGSMAPTPIMPFIYPGMLPWLKKQKKSDDKKRIIHEPAL